MKVIVAGGREVSREMADKLVEEAFRATGWGDVCEVIHGACSGIDMAAHRFALGKWKVTPVPAEWHVHGKAAGPIRNRKMAGMGDALIAIWDGESRGTKNMIEEAKKKGLLVYIHRYEREPQA